MMDMQTDATIEQEGRALRVFVSDFFTHYYTERSCEKVLFALAENAIFVGLSDDEIAYNRDACRPILTAQMEAVSKPIPYFVNEYVQSRCQDGSWNCCAQIDLNVVSSKWGTTKYNVRVTMSVCRTATGFQITMAHVSESAVFRDGRREFGKKSEGARNAAQREIGRIMSQVIPGGIVSRYVSAGSPISIVNDEYLRMLHHPTFYDFMEDCGGRFENSIHPADLEKFQYTVHFIMTTGKQCECEYRVRRSDGNYIWVHDTGRKAISTDGRDLMVSVLTDMSDRIHRQQQLERENETDSLTAVYNRRGAIRRFLDLHSQYSNYALMVLDIDNFKLINDLYGHQQGDRALIFVARLLLDSFGDGGIVCRLGGDEFAVFLPNYTHLEILQDVMETVIHLYQALMDQRCPESRSSLSVGGVYGSHPIDPPDIERVFDLADANLYAIKNRNKNGIHLSPMPN